MKKHFPRSYEYILALFVFTFALSSTLGMAYGQAVRLDRDNPNIRAAIEVQNRHTAKVMGIPGVVGMGTAIGTDGRPVIRVFTTRAGIPEIPRSLDGLPVEVEVTGMVVAFADPTARFPRPVPIGVSTGHPDITAGTIGCRVIDGQGNVYALSNNHVYANSNDASLEDCVIQPGTLDGGIVPGDCIGNLAGFVEIDFSGGNNTVDAAIAASSVEYLDNATPADGYGTPSSTTEVAYVGQAVQKYGRTTGWTYGEVSEINVTVDVCYECAVSFGPFCLLCGKLARFVDQIAITPGDFSAGGDSGSVIVTQSLNNNPVGLLFAGSSTRTIANNIDAVLAALEVSIDGSVAAPLTDVAVTEVGAPASVMQGDVASVYVTVQNVGNQDVGAFEVTLDTTEGVVIDTPQGVSSLAAGASTTLTFSWDTDTASPGDHTLTASHNLGDDNSSNDSSSTTVTVNEPTAGVSVTSIYPNTMQAGTTRDVTIGGSGFVDGADVAFENGAGPAPQASNIAVVDANTVTATVRAKSGGPPRNRLWDVRVTNPDGSSGVLVGGFTVTP